MCRMSQTGSGVQKTFNVIVVDTWTALPATSTSMLKPTVVSFREHPTPQETQEQKKERKRKRQRQGGPPAKRGAAAGLQTLQANEEEEVEEEEEKQDLPPQHVFFDIEAMQPKEHHVANLVVVETENDPRPFRFRGDQCIKQFLEWLDALTLEDTRQVNVIAHNFQGYDGYFVVNQYHSDNQIVKQLRNGCKLLEVKHESIRFIDSLSFFQMPLSAFPKPLGSPISKRVTSPTSSTFPKTKSTWDPSPPSTTTCLKSCALMDVKSLKNGTRSNATTKSSLISKKNWWPTVNPISAY